MASNGSPSGGHGGGHQYPVTVNYDKLHQGDHYGDVNNYYGTAGGPQRAFQEKVDTCRNALFLTDPIVDRETLKSTKGQRTAGTCEWIKDNETYKSWLEGNSQCLWISGGPGKGKTMLSIFLIEEFETRTQGTKDAVLFYFCSHQDEKRNSAVTVLRGLAYQLVRERRELPKDVLSWFESPEKTQMTLSSAEALWIIFKTLLQAPELGTVFCVLDGLDECDAASSRLLVDKLCQYCSPKSSKPSGGLLKLAIVSRKIARLDAFLQVKLDSDNDDYVSGNIRLFISARVQELERVQGFDSIRKTVEGALLSRANGTFLWVGFVMGELSKKNTCTEIMETLYSFPPGLDAIYNRMLRQIESSRQDTVSKILRWVTMALRPLTLLELTAAIFPSTTHVGSDQAIRDHITLCGPILEIHNQQVRLVHQSAKDYCLREKPDDDPILEKFGIRVEEAHAELAKTCLDYIEKSDLRNESLDIEDAFVQRQWPLLNYATLHWPEHARQSSTHSDDGVDLKRPFFQKPSIVRINWWVTYQKANRKSNWLDPDVSGLPLLHTASYFGIESLARKLLLKTVWDLTTFRKSVNKKDKYGRTALSLAAGGGREAIVKLLLEKGADVNKKGKYGSTALIQAAKEGHEVIVQLLLEQGADVNAMDDGGTALIRAARGGHDAIVQLLLKKGADVNANDYGRTALSLAAANGHEATAQLLLKKGVDMNAMDDDGRTALIRAAEGGHEAIAQLLLEKGADVNAMDDDGGTALIQAAGGGHEAIAQLLLKKGADINAKDDCGWTALIRAAVDRHEAIVQLLLEKGANVNAKADDGFTALIGAAVRGHEAIAQLLLRKGADVNAKDDCGWTVLMGAARGGNGAIIKLLLEKGADVNTKGTGGEMALVGAARGGNGAIIKLLLEKGADVNAKADDGWTALIGAAVNGHEAIVKLLLEKGADVNAKTDYGGTALIEAAANGHDAIVQLLLEKGADVNDAEVNTKGTSGETALIRAAVNGHEAIVKLLLEKGAEVNTKGTSGEMALIRAAVNGHEAIVKLLLEKGADVNAKPDYGWTALIGAAGGGREAIVKLLLEKGADVNAKTDYGGTALIGAAAKGHDAIVQLLLEQGADVNAMDDGGTALIRAARGGHEAIVQLLVEKGAGVNTRNVHGWTALIQAARGGHEAIVQLLVEKGAGVNAKNDDGGTALIQAAGGGHEAIVKLLLEKGAGVYAKDKYGLTALNLAAQEGHERIVQLLLEKGAD